MSTLATFELLFDDRVRDTGAKLGSTERARAIAQALTRYAQVRPVIAVQDYPGDGSTFDLALPTGYVEGLSTILSIEYPLGERVPALLETSAWSLYRTTTALKLRLLSTTPATGKTARVTFTKPHVVDVAGSTVPVTDEAAVGDLAAAVGLRELAALYANTQDPTIAADVVNYRSKSEEYLRLAKELEGRYRAHLGLDKETEVRAGYAFTDVDQETTHGLEKLTHPNSRR